MSAYGGSLKNLKDLKDPVYAKGEVFAYVGLSQNLNDLTRIVRLSYACQSFTSVPQMGLHFSSL